MIPSSGARALPLNDEELARLDDLLSRASDDDAMTLEEFDGFPAATLASPVALKSFADFLDKRGSVDVLCGMLESAERAHSAGCCEGESPKKP